MGKNKNINGKQKQRLEEVPELEEGEEYYDYSDEEGYGLDMLDGEDNWAAGATAGQYDPWGAKPTAQQSAGGSQWGGMPQNTIPTPAQMAAHAAASGSKGGGGEEKKIRRAVVGKARARLGKAGARTIIRRLRLRLWMHGELPITGEVAVVAVVAVTGVTAAAGVPRQTRTIGDHPPTRGAGKPRNPRNKLNRAIGRAGVKRLGSYPR
ncbi:hypothetical protein C8R43DRAFT_104651 [Mycena crocata]|nr:hypothetical protein C8R43DRAFT_104651 [Mycena crocata]